MARFVRISLLTLGAALLLATLVHSQDAPRRVRAYQDRQNELKAQGEANEQQSLGAIWAGGLELEAGRDGGLSRIAGLTGDEIVEDDEKHPEPAASTGMRVERIKRGEPPSPIRPSWRRAADFSPSAATTTRVTTTTKKVTTTGRFTFYAS